MCPVFDCVKPVWDQSSNIVDIGNKVKIMNWLYLRTEKSRDHLGLSHYDCYLLLLLQCTFDFLKLCPFLADRTNARAYATVLRLLSSSVVVCDVMYCG